MKDGGLIFSPAPVHQPLVLNEPKTTASVTVVTERLALVHRLQRLESMRSLELTDFTLGAAAGVLLRSAARASVQP
jgi:hypothetical protein